MEEVTVETPKENALPKSQPMVVRKNNNAPLVGAIIFLALVIGAAAIYLGTQNNNEVAIAIARRVNEKKINSVDLIVDNNPEAIRFGYGQLG